VRKPSGIVFPREGNVLWPLPPDYAALTGEGQRMARVNACRLQQTPKLALHSWRYFCRQYLAPEVLPDGSTWDSCFYERYEEPSVLHYRLIHLMESVTRLALAMPRGGAKSTVFTSYSLYKMVTNPQWLVNYYTSKFDPLVKRFFDKTKTQLAFNERLVNDFGVLKPKRGEGIWGGDYIRLNNFSSACGFSIDGKLRGPRATGLNIVDDIERDPELGKLPSPEEVEETNRKIVQVIIPTMREGVPLAVGGTLLHQRSFINHACTEADPGSPDFDARFASVNQGGTWHKRIYAWCDAQGNSYWPEVWTPTYIEQLRRELGPAIFATEMENRPISEGERTFTIDPKLHEYHVDVPPDDLSPYEEPFRSHATVRWHECSGSAPVTASPKTTAWSEHVKQMVRGIVVDSIENPSPTSDFAVVLVGGMDMRGDLWLLDLYAAKKANTQLCYELWHLIQKWQIPLVGAEDAAFCEEYFNQSQQLQDHLMETLGFVPQCLSLKPPTNMSKGQRIRRIEWRFPWGKIKYPADRSRDSGWAMLYDQTLRFTEDLKNLRHDDCIDTVEMLQRLLKGQRAVALPQASNEEDPVQRFLEGESFDPATGAALLTPADIPRLDPETQAKVFEEINRRAYERRTGGSGDDDLDGAYADGYEETDIGEIW